MSRSAQENDTLSEATLLQMATRVYEALGADHVEEIYKHAMLIELRKAGLRYTCEQSVEIFYLDEHVGWGYADIVVHEKDGNTLIELKVASAVKKGHVQQAKNYIRQLKIKRGFVVNFGASDSKKDKDQKLMVASVSMVEQL